MTELAQPQDAPTQRFEVRDVGRVGRLRLDLAPGVNVLLGPHGSGKTTAIAATAAACARTTQGLVVRDGERYGSVIGPGVTLTIGERQGPSGTPTVELADHGILHQLVETPGASAKTRHKHRAKLLLGLVDLDVTQAVLLELSDNDQEVVAVARAERSAAHKGLGGASAAVKAAAHDLARAAREEHDRHAGARDAAAARAAQLRDGLDEEGQPIPVSSSDALALEHERLTAEVGRLEADASRRRAVEAERDSWGDIGPRPDVEGARADEARASDCVWRLRDQMRRLEVELAVAQEAEKAAARNRQKAEGDAEDWDAKRAQLDTPIEGPTNGDVAAAIARRDQAKYQLELARCAEELEQLVADRDHEAAAAAKAGAEADRLKALAQGVPARVNAILARHQVGPLAIDGEGRLCHRHADGRLEDWERRSLGQRVTDMLELGLSLYPGSVMPLDPGFWAGLVPTTQRSVVAQAVDRGIAIVTEAPADIDGVRTVHLGARYVESGLDAYDYLRQATATS